jgi:hypothetical protein
VIFPFSMIAAPVVEASDAAVGGASLALYFNVFVAIVQSFDKIPALKAMAPTQSKPPFKLTQLLALACSL